VSDDGVLQVGDWHHLKISIKSADGTHTSDDHNIFYRVVVNKDTWALSANSYGNSSVVSSSPGIQSLLIVYITRGAVIVNNHCSVIH